MQIIIISWATKSQQAPSHYILDTANDKSLHDLVANAWRFNFKHPLDYYIHKINYASKPKLSQLFFFPSGKMSHQKHDFVWIFDISISQWKRESNKITLILKWEIRFSWFTFGEREQCFSVAKVNPNKRFHCFRVNSYLRFFCMRNDDSME